MCQLLSLCFLFHQILYMVGRGYVQPDMSKVRSDIPKSFRRLCTDCYAFSRENRPLFPQVGFAFLFQFLEDILCCLGHFLAHLIHK